jgi:hypothetical protein
MYFSFNKTTTLKTPFLKDQINYSIDKYIKLMIYSNDLIKQRILLNNIIYNNDSIITHDKLITYKPKLFPFYNLIILVSIGVSIFIKKKL